MMSVTLAVLRILAEGGAFAALGAIATLVGASIVAKLEPLPDGPAPGRPADLVLIVLAGLVGVAAAVAGHDSAAQLFVAAVTVYAVVGAIYCDVARGIVPDFFTLLPLGLLVLLALAQGHPALLLAALLPAIPFAIARLSSTFGAMYPHTIATPPIARSCMSIECPMIIKPTAGSPSRMAAPRRQATNADGVTLYQAPWPSRRTSLPRLSLLSSRLASVGLD